MCDKSNLTDTDIEAIGLVIGCYIHNRFRIVSYWLIVITMLLFLNLIVLSMSIVTMNELFEHMFKIYTTYLH